ncbi:MAG TPA: HAD family hydrolase [Candidatus Saccharimonadia bacterium]|nr:HAD family hydrolase [Candidatus Saccharimonadia bacterium]
MSVIKLVVTDIDGTLVEVGQHAPTSAVREAMQAMQAAGVLVAAATARPYEMAHGLFSEIGLSGPSIFDGGASIRDVQTGELLWQNWLSVPRLQEIAAVILPHAKMVDFFPVGNMIPASELNAKELTEDAPYVWAMVEESAVAGIQSELARLLGLNVHLGVGRPDEPGLIDLQITDTYADKFHAVTELRKLVAATKVQTLAIGDSSNDMPLFESAGVKIAMGNAIPALKELANHTVATVQEDGWAEAMNRFVLS